MICAVASMPYWSKMYDREAAKHGGKAPPEARLPPAMAGAFLTVIGLFIFGEDQGGLTCCSRVGMNADFVTCGCSIHIVSSCALDRSYHFRYTVWNGRRFGESTICKVRRARHSYNEAVLLFFASRYSSPSSHSQPTPTVVSRREVVLDSKRWR